MCSDTPLTLSLFLSLSLSLSSLPIYLCVSLSLSHTHTHTLSHTPFQSFFVHSILMSQNHVLPGPDCCHFGMHELAFHESPNKVTRAHCCNKRPKSPLIWGHQTLRHLMQSISSAGCDPGLNFQSIIFADRLSWR